MYGTNRNQLLNDLEDLRTAGLFKHERRIHGAQGGSVALADRTVLNFCANDYLGLAAHPTVVASAHAALDERGFGMASVRFICGTQDRHGELEEAIASYVGAEDAILYSSCFDANGGVFETLLGPEDAVISDELNHASIIDGIRLSRAARCRYGHMDLVELERSLVASRGARRRLVVTDGVFSMDGHVAPLDGICELAERYDALVMVDDSHAVGVLGPTGAGTPELFGVQDRVDIVSGTFGKALGGASGGYVAAHTEIVQLLRQRSRPYLFSNAVAPAVVAGSSAALALSSSGAALRRRLHANTSLLRTMLVEEGFDVLPGEHPIVPVMFGDAPVAAAMAEQMLAHGVYVVAFSYPVVPPGEARIRVQLSAAHSEADVVTCAEAFHDARTRVERDSSAGRKRDARSR